MLNGLYSSATKKRKDKWGKKTMQGGFHPGSDKQNLTSICTRRNIKEKIDNKRVINI